MWTRPVKSWINLSNLIPIRNDIASNLIRAEGALECGGTTPLLNYVVV